MAEISHPPDFKYSWLSLDLVRELLWLVFGVVALRTLTALDLFVSMIELSSQHGELSRFFFAESSQRRPLPPLSPTTTRPFTVLRSIPNRRAVPHSSPSAVT